MLRPSLMVNTWKSRVRTNTEPIHAEIILHCSLRFLAGGLYLEIMCNAVLSHTAFYSSIYKGIDAINRCPDLALKLPRSLEELHDAADEFASLSRDQLLNWWYLFGAEVCVVWFFIKPYYWQRPGKMCTSWLMLSSLK